MKMALRQSEKTLLGFINETAKMLSELNIEESLIIEKLKDKVGELEQSANCKLALVEVDGIRQFNVIDLSADYVRTRFNNAEKTMLSLRAKILGLSVEVKVKKDDDVFSNKEVSKSLRELAGIVDEMPIEMLLHGQDDWSRTPGEMPKLLAGEKPLESDLTETEMDKVEQPEAEVLVEPDFDDSFPEQPVKTELPGEPVAPGEVPDAQSAPSDDTLPPSAESLI
jgi:hypothetical protein